MSPGEKSFDRALQQWEEITDSILPPQPPPNPSFLGVGREIPVGLMKQKGTYVIITVKGILQQLAIVWLMAETCLN